MSNDLTSGRVWVVDTVGIVTERAIYLRRIVMIPNAANDAANFVYWKGTDDTVSAGTLFNKTGTITSNSTLTSTGNLPSDVAAGYIFEITKSSGAAANVDKHLIATAGDTNAVIVTLADWTNEASKVYDWRTIKTYQAPYIKAGASDASPVTLDFGPECMRFPNLVLQSLSTSAKLYLYLDRG